MLWKVRSNCRINTYMKSSHLQIIMGEFATLVEKDKFVQLTVHATTTIQNSVKEIVTERLSEYKAAWREYEKSYFGCHGFVNELCGDLTLKKFKVVRNARVVEHDALLHLVEKLMENLTVLPTKKNAEDTGPAIQAQGKVDAGAVEDKDAKEKEPTICCEKSFLEELSIKEALCLARSCEETTSNKIKTEEVVPSAVTKKKISDDSSAALLKIVKAEVAAQIKIKNKNAVRIQVVKRSFRRWSQRGCQDRLGEKRIISLWKSENSSFPHSKIY